jgi:beta-glucanase (GH16 family)
VYKESLSKKWHTYGIIWDSEIVKYTFDGKVWAELSLESLGEGSYVYGDSFTSPYGYSIIFCLAIGGNYLNNELPLDSTWDGPLEDRCLEVDWVRVYGK